MTLNIKNSQVHSLATELASLRDVSLTQAVLEAVRNELEREKTRRRKNGLASQLLGIGKRCAAHVRAPVSSAGHGAMLYDRRGLPR